jgi:CSLREA domain-containing protein
MKRTRRPIAVGLIAAAAVALLGAHSGNAATFTVNTATDAVDASPGNGVCETAPANGVCTLRAAIQEQNALGGLNAINLPAGTYTLTIPGIGEDAGATGDLDVAGFVAILGAGAATTIIDGGALDRVFDTRGTNVTIAAVTVRNGIADHGGGIRNADGGTLNVNVSIVTDNTATDAGGGILNRGTVTLTSSIVSGNSAEYGGGASSYGVNATMTITNCALTGNSVVDGGGALQNGNFATVTLTGTTVSANESGRIGGGIENGASGTTALTNVTVSGNTAVDAGGGIFNSNAGAVTLTNATVSGNSSGRIGGGIHNQNDGNVALASSTVTGNTATEDGGGLINSAIVSLRNTILAGNEDFDTYPTQDGYTPECDNGGTGDINSLGYNLVEDPHGCTMTGDLASNIYGLPVRLGPLADNGGLTQTHALMFGSPAIDAGDNTGCPGTDQRGVARPQETTCDIGAYESTCGNGAPDAGEQCDDGDGNCGDGCDPNCTVSSCGNEFTCLLSGEQCDNGADNGIDSCCSATCELVVDTDADGVCDPHDPCTNVAGARDITVKPKGVVGKINANVDPTDDTLSIAGEFVLPNMAFATIDPQTNGARVLIENAAGVIKADLTLPPGAFADTVGWTVNGSGTKWTYRDKTGVPRTGITSMLIQDRSKKMANQVKVKVKGKGGTYPIATADVPVRFTFVLGGQAASIAGQCGESAFIVSDCTFNAAMNKVACQQ